MMIPLWVGLVGVFAGMFAGVFLMCLLQVSRRDDTPAAFGPPRLPRS